MYVPTTISDTIPIFIAIIDFIHSKTGKIFDEYFIKYLFIIGIDEIVELLPKLGMVLVILDE